MGQPFSAPARPFFARPTGWCAGLALSALFVALSADLQAQDAPGNDVEHGTLSTLRSTTREVLLDVVVTDASGRTVRNLAPGDFVVKEDGVEQKTHLIETPPQAIPRGLAAGSQLASTQTMGTSAPGAVPEQPRMRTLILLDEVNVKFLDLAFARKRLDVFLAGPNAQGQPIGLLALTNNKLVLVHDFSTDREALRRSLRQLPGELPTTANAAVDEYKDFENFTNAISSLETIARSLEGSQIRTNCIWITSGFPTMAKLINSPEIQDNFDTIMKHTANLYLGARMAVYTIDPHGVQFESTLPYHNAQPGIPPGGRVIDYDDGAEVARQTLTMTPASAVINGFLGALDERTGGRGYSNQNDIDVPLAQAIEDASSSYVLAYAPANHDFHGEYRRIRVELRTSGLHARTRDGYIAESRTEGNSPDKIRTVLQRALESPLPYDGLRTEARLGTAGKTQTLNVRVAPENVEWMPTGAGGEVAQVIAVAAYGTSGKPLYSREYRVSTKLAELPSKSALSYTLPLTVPAQTARLRLAVVDQHGSHVGTTDVALP